MPGSPYTVLLTHAARRDYGKLPPDIEPRVSSAIDALEESPCHPGARKLKGERHLFRVRVGDFRIIYHVDESDRVVTIARIRHRREVYRS